MGEIGSTAEVLNYVVEEVEKGFDPYYINRTNYRLEPNTPRSVIIQSDGYQTDDKWERWEKVYFTLKLRDFIYTLGVAAHEKPKIKTLKPWGPGG